MAANRQNEDWLQVWVETGVKDWLLVDIQMVRQWKRKHHYKKFSQESEKCEAKGLKRVDWDFNVKRADK